MSTTDSDSRMHLSQGPAARDGGISHSRVEHSGQIWLNGDVLACVCPECQAPMSIRLWLRVADCWRCGTSIELTEEQEQFARKLLEERQSQLSMSITGADVAPAPAPAAAQAAAPLTTAPAWSQPVVPSFKAPTFTPPGRVAAALKPSRVRADAHERQQDGPLRYWIRRTFGNLPAFLVSIILHMIVIILLGLWVVSIEEKPPGLVLAVEVNGWRKEGDAITYDTPSVGVEFDAPMLKKIEPAAEIAIEATSKSVPREIKVADAPGDLFDNMNTAIPINLPTGGQGDIFAGRDPRVRTQLAIREGGTTKSEAAVARALKWLAAHQSEDGRWRLDAFQHAGDCNGQCRSPGVRSDTSGTALGLLPFLGAGQTHQKGDYIFVVAKGLRALMDQQKSDGDLRGNGGGNTGMYAHGQAAIALCEAYALTKDSILRGPAQKSLDFIVQAQHKEGGWRYRPGEAGDTSVVGWQLMALRSGRLGGLDVPEETFTRAGKFLDSVQVERTRGLFGYMPGSGASDAMTAEGLLSRQYSGSRKNDPVLITGISWLLQKHPPQERRPDMYYWYYATQVMHHAGGPAWEEWNGQLRDILVDMQETTGHQAGSWTPRYAHDPRGGRVYMTALATCTLEVYYRHMPLYRGEAVSGQAKKK